MQQCSKVVCFHKCKFVGLCCKFVSAISLVLFEISFWTFLWEQDMVRSTDEFESGCIAMHYDTWVVV